LVGEWMGFVGTKQLDGPRSGKARVQNTQRRARANRRAGLASAQIVSTAATEHQGGLEECPAAHEGRSAAAVWGAAAREHCAALLHRQLHVAQHLEDSGVVGDGVYVCVVSDVHQESSQVSRRVKRQVQLGTGEGRRRVRFTLSNLSGGLRHNKTWFYYVFFFLFPHFFAVFEGDDWAEVGRGVERVPDLRTHRPSKQGSKEAGKQGSGTDKKRRRKSTMMARRTTPQTREMAGEMLIGVKSEIDGATASAVKMVASHGTAAAWVVEAGDDRPAVTSSP